MEWQSIKSAVPTPGVEIVIRMHPTLAQKAMPRLLGMSVHQIATWDGEGQLRLAGYVVPLEVVEGCLPLPATRIGRHQSGTKEAGMVPDKFTPG
ncbi:hypothetical protein [Caudoviricetes sp.]|nr:hypothetical protein [Caudoviricetes sp.]